MEAGTAIRDVTGLLEGVLAKYTPVEVQAIRVAETYLVGFPGELFVEYGLALKKRAGKPCFPVSLVNGELQGYVVTEGRQTRRSRPRNTLLGGRYGAAMRHSGVDSTSSVEPAVPHILD